MIDVELTWFCAGERIKLVGDRAMLIFVHSDLQLYFVEQSSSEPSIIERFERRRGMAEQHCQAKYFGRRRVRHFSKDFLEKPFRFHIG